MAVRIRMKHLGRRHRPFFRICAMDQRSPRDGKALEELGTYDPMVADVDARVQLNGERIQYWLSVGAIPSENVGVLIKKYGVGGTHLAEQKAALQRLAEPRNIPDPGPPASRAKPADAKQGATATAEPESPTKTAPISEPGGEESVPETAGERNAEPGSDTPSEEDDGA